MKPLFKKTVFSLIPVIVLLILIEVLLRIFYIPKTTPFVRQFVNPEWNSEKTYTIHHKYFWIFEPNTTMGVNNPVIKKEIKINNIGFRGEDWKPDDIEKRLRIMFLGDSCVFGWNIEVDNIADKIVAHFKEENPYIFQGGVPGYSSFQIRQVFDDWAPKVKPHYVIIYVGTNDVLPRVNKADSEIYQDDINFWKRMTIFRLSYIFALIQDMQYRKRVSKLTSNYYDYYDPWIKKNPGRVSLNESRDNISYIVRKTLEANAIPIILTRQGDFIKPRFIKNEEEKQKKEKENMPIPVYNRMLLEVGKKYNAKVIKIHELAEKEDPKKFYHNYPYDEVHPSSYGYDLITKEIIPVINIKEKNRKLNW
ncbi:MAG: SGNH/GDSL hydrolase family protein [Candidatus Coatesbacteria bacterium]|nr:SGNH/GDSL hydrolase family protein [Candidatus Coatesbacteria bacterium]